MFKAFIGRREYDEVARRRNWPPRAGKLRAQASLVRGADVARRAAAIPSKAGATDGARWAPLAFILGAILTLGAMRESMRQSIGLLLAYALDRLG